MSVTINAQTNFVLTKNTVGTVIPIRLARLAYGIQAPRGWYYLGYGLDPTQEAGFKVWSNPKGPDEGFISAAGPISGQGNQVNAYEGDVRVLYIEGPATLTLRILEISA